MRWHKLYSSYSIYFIRSILFFIFLRNIGTKHFVSMTNPKNIQNFDLNPFVLISRLIEFLFLLNAKLLYFLFLKKPFVLVRISFSLSYFHYDVMGMSCNLHIIVEPTKDHLSLRAFSMVYTKVKYSL